MSYKHIFSVFFAATLMFTALCGTSGASSRIDIEHVRGPKINELSMIIISNPDAQILAAEAGDIDILSDITRPTDINRIAHNKNLTLTLARGMHAFFLLLNNKVFPWNDAVLRKAAAMSVDRSGIVRMIFGGYCEPINSWLPPVSPWAPSNSAQDIYDPKAARALLKKHGYSWNMSGVLTAPNGKPLPVMKLLTPLARVAPTTAELAELIADSLSSVGFPVQTEPMDFSAMISVIDRKDYSMALMAWSMGRDPDSLYSFYHSDMDVDGGYNMTGVHDKRLDRELYSLRHAPDKKSAAKYAATSQKLLAEIIPSVPIYSRFSVSAVSKKWKNIFTTDKITADNIWTLLCAEPKDGKMRPMRMLLAEEPRNLNPFSASTAYSWQVLGMIYETLLSTNPYTLENMHGLAKTWKVSTKNTTSGQCTELDFTLQSGIKWNDGSPLTAADVKASMDFIRKNKIPRFFDSVKNIAYITTSDNNKIHVVMNGVSYWYLDNIAGLPILPKKVLDAIKDWQRWDPLDRAGTFGPYGLVGTGPFAFKSYRPGEFLLMKKNKFYRLLEAK
ncbi:MAG: ABC transporter substrate-binding protein [Synergistes sp.]|nr:ABC transporter substrate-binding protein [Synergistes sp.]